MKKIIKNLMYLGLFSVALIFNSCQEEFEEVNSNSDQETITASSTTASLIKNTSANDGSFDNIVDGASCFAINFPYTVEIAGSQITVDSREDLRFIERIFDEFDDDNDILELFFPIVITLGDFTEITIESKEALRELIAECTEGEDDDIECIDFVYPITLFTFDVNNQQTGSVVIESDRELRRFFAGLGDNDLVSINYPITLEKFDGTELMVSSNAELAVALESAKDECDEDDDNDFNDDDFNEERLDDLLAECPWLVREIRRNGTDQTDQYFESVLNFNEDGTVTLRDRSRNMFTGTWETSISENGALLNLEFEALADFSLEWLVYDIGDGRIKFFGNDNNRIVLRKFCGDNEQECSEAFIANTLSSGMWNPSSEGQDSLNGLSIDFSNRNIHVFDANGVAADEGNWSISGNTLTFNDLTLELANYNGDWEVVECGEERFKLKRGEEHLILEKQDEGNNDDQDSLRNILKECEWLIRKVENQGEEINRLLGYKFEFMAEGVVTLSNGINTSEGTWEVGVNSDLELALLISLGDGAIDFNWPLRELTNRRLRFEVEDIGYELLLQRTCEDDANDSDVTEIRNIMLDGQWNVALYDNEGQNGTAAFAGRDFSFSLFNQVEVSMDNDPQIGGLWRVTRARAGNLQFFLNFEDDPTFGELTEAWYIVEVTANRIELVFEDEDVNFKLLVFEKSM